MPVIRKWKAFKINKGIAIPPREFADAFRTRLLNALQDMKPDDMIETRFDQAAYARSIVVKFSADTGRTFTTRRIGKKLGIWRN